MIPSASQGALKLMLLQVRWLWASLKEVPRHHESEQRVPMTIEISATNEDSTRKLSPTIRRWKPIARTTPICWRR